MKRRMLLFDPHFIIGNDPATGNICAVLLRLLPKIITQTIKEVTAVELG